MLFKWDQFQTLYCYFVFNFIATYGFVSEFGSVMLFDLGSNWSRLASNRMFTITLDFQKSGYQDDVVVTSRLAVDATQSH